MAPRPLAADVGQQQAVAVADEARRLGLVTVFLDDGVAADRPALAVPLNLPEALGLPGDGTAHVGLTAATGERWQAHDVTSWAVCDRPGRDAVP